MDSDAKHAEVEVYDGNGSSRPAYGSLWDETHFERLLQAGPARIFKSSLQNVADGNRVLVLGCGTGSTVHSAIDEGGTQAVGIELSQTRLREARDNVQSDQVSFARADAEELPFSRNRFDVVISHSVLHHLPNWRTAALEEIRRVLTEDGTFLLYEPGRYNLPAVARRKLIPSNIHTPDERPFDPDELERVLNGHFNSVDLEGHCLLSNVIPVLANYSPFSLPTWIGPKLYDLERPIIRHGGMKFSWVLTGIAEAPRPLPSQG